MLHMSKTVLLANLAELSAHLDHLLYNCSDQLTILAKR